VPSLEQLAKNLWSGLTHNLPTNNENDDDDDDDDDDES
jgi:hypothetical protein